MHIDSLMETNNMERTSHQQLMKQHRDQFCSWYKSYVRILFILIIKCIKVKWNNYVNKVFKSQVDKLDMAGRMELGDKLVSHAKGPMFDAQEYNRYVVNGVLYRTVDVDKEKKSQNCGVCVPCW